MAKLLRWFLNDMNSDISHDIGDLNYIINQTKTGEENFATIEGCFIIYLYYSMLTTQSSLVRIQKDCKRDSTVLIIILTNGI